MFKKSNQGKELTLLVCFLLQFLVALDALITVPISADIALSLNVSPTQSGYLIAIYSICAASASVFIFAGHSVGQEIRKILMWGVILALITWLTSISDEFYSVMVLRGLTGFAGGALSILNLNLVLLCASSERKKGDVAIVLSAFPLALAFGVPILLLVSGHDQWQSAFLLVSILLLLVLGIFCFVVKPSSDTNKTSLAIDNQVEVNASYYTFVIHPALLLFITIVTTFVVSTQFPVMLITKLNIEHHWLSGCYLVSGVITFSLIQGYARIALAQQRVTVIIGVLSILMIVAALTGFSTQATIFASSMFILFVITSSLRSLLVTSEVLAATSASLRHVMVRWQNVLQHLAVAAGGWLGSVLLSINDQQIDFSNMLVVFVGLVFISCLWCIYYCSQQVKRE